MSEDPDREPLYFTIEELRALVSEVDAPAALAKKLHAALRQITSRAETKKNQMNAVIAIAPLDKWRFERVDDRCSECGHGYGYGSMLKPPFTCPIRGDRCTGWRPK